MPSFEAIFCILDKIFSIKLKIISNIFWRVENYHYLCSVFHLECAPKVTKKG